MPVLDGIEATTRIVRAQPSARVLILTTFGLDTYVYDALRAGASGFMLKDAPPEEIAAAVRIVASGEALLAPAVTRAVIEEFARHPPSAPATPPPAVAELTPREQEVLDLLAREIVQPRDLRTARDQRSNGKDARRAHPAEARPPRPRAGSDLRLRDRASRSRQWLSIGCQTRRADCVPPEVRFEAPEVVQMLARPEQHGRGMDRCLVSTARGVAHACKQAATTVCVANVRWRNGAVVHERVPERDVPRLERMERT